MRGSNTKALSSVQELFFLATVLFFHPGNGLADRGVFCASWEASGSIPTNGFFAMQIDKSTASYSFELRFAPNAEMFAVCPSLRSNTSTLKFHFHSLWGWGRDRNISFLSDCSSTYVGAHYDPNFACGPQSSWSAAVCSSIGRALPTYLYNCTPASFNRRNGQCEVGDLSGKFGPASVSVAAFDPVFRTVISPSTGMYLVDFLPPYVADYDLSNGAGWTSIVMHCGDPAGARLLCARLVPVADWSQCASDAYPPPTDGCACPSSTGSAADAELATSSDLIMGYVLTVLSLLCIVVTHLHMRGKTLNDF